MKLREFGKTGVKVSEIGFGGWSIGEPQWGSPDVDDSIAAVEAALEAGVTFFDTAQEYGYGRSEEIFGKVLGGREGVFVATKTGKYWQEGKFHADYSPEHIVRSAEDSLRRLKTDCIDLYQLHNPGKDVSARPETWEAQQQLPQQGKIRFTSKGNSVYAYILSDDGRMPEQVTLGKLKPARRCRRQGDTDQDSRQLQHCIDLSRSEPTVG